MPNLNNKYFVSVIIPVFNLEDYISKAIDSVLPQKHVDEIIIVDDGSTDNTGKIIQDYANQYPEIIRIVTHPNRENRGLGASRNAGIKAANCEYIAFLDGDDFYLPNRFETTKKVFSMYPDADGVYEALGTKFYSENAKRQFLKTFPYFKSQDQDNILTTMNVEADPKELFNLLVLKSFGGLHTNTLTLRKSIFKKSGYFKENMILHGDNEAFLRFAYYGKLYPGLLNEAVAIRGVHEKNRVTTNQDIRKRSTFNEEKYLSFSQKKLTKKQATIFLKDYLFGHHLKFRSNKILKYVSYCWVIPIVILKDPHGFFNLFYRGFLK